MSNPLLGKRISLISKKNIRYEGVLYSINEQNATVALQNVRTFGTEGRETSEQGCVFVGPTDTVHPYLLFRGQDIKDLHVHESQAPTAEESESSSKEAEPAAVEKASAPPAETKKKTTTKAKAESSERSADENKKQHSTNRGSSTGGGSYNRRQRSQKAAVGTGASLLTRSVRGAVSGSSETPQGDFDFQSSLEQFQKETASDDDEEAGDDPTGAAYAKDDFFDSISCDALDKKTGVDYRLRGSAERHLNTETFGAVALNTQRRRRGRGGGRGRGRFGGGRGRGRGRGGRGRGGYYGSKGSSNRSGSQASAAVS